MTKNTLKILGIIITTFLALSCTEQSISKVNPKNKKVGLNAKDKASALKKLSPLQFRVTQKDDTEPPFKNKYWDNKRDGIYVDVVSGEALFSSKEKYKSGTGWPSFYDTIAKKNIILKKDSKLFITRTEVRSKNADSHLGHLFKDGPKPTGLRYCMNSASLKFIPVEDLEKEGYKEYLKMFDKKPSGEDAQKIRSSSSTDFAIFAGGCFWGMEELFSKFKGVVDTEVGYTGGDSSASTYNEVKTGKTGHAEALKIYFNKTEVTYEELLHFFFKIHDPTTLNRQGNDVGSQYRSAVFVKNEEQRDKVKKVIKEVTDLKRFKNPIVTEVEDQSKFNTAEAYHQDYLKKNPGGYTCHFIRD